MGEELKRMVEVAKGRVNDAEVELTRSKEWLQGLEGELEQSKKQKVSEEATDSRILLNG